MWHIDTTVIRLLDGTRAYLHAVIDNFSRRILGVAGRRHVRAGEQRGRAARGRSGRDAFSDDSGRERQDPAQHARGDVSGMRTIEDRHLRIDRQPATDRGVILRTSQIAVNVGRGLSAFIIRRNSGRRSNLPR